MVADVIFTGTSDGPLTIGSIMRTFVRLAVAIILGILVSVSSVNVSPAHATSAVIDNAWYTWATYTTLTACESAGVALVQGPLPIVDYYCRENLTPDSWALRVYDTSI